MSICVGHVVPFASRIGGYEKQAILLASKQAESGYSVYIITHADDAAKLSKNLNEQLNRPDYNKIKIVGIPSLAKFFFKTSKIKRIIKKIDIIHAHALDRLSANIIKTAKHLKKPVIVKIATGGDINRFANPHKYPSMIIEAKSTYGKMLRSIIQPYLMRNTWNVIKKSDSFIAINSAIVQEMLQNRIDKSRIHKLPNAVIIPDKVNRSDNKGLNSLYVGRLEQRKCVNDILSAFEIVNKKIPDATLTIVGDGSYKNKLEQKYRNIATFTGYITDPTEYYNRSDIFVFASEQEGCPNAVLEAAASGLACITTDIDGINDWLRRDQDIKLVPVHNPEILAQKWISLINNHESQIKLGNSAKFHLKKLANVAIICNKYDDLYNDLLNP